MRISQETQQAMTDAVRHMVEQGERCVDTLGACMYFGHDGARCAIGWMLPADMRHHIETTFGVEQEGDVIALVESCTNPWEPYDLPASVLELHRLCISKDFQEFHDARRCVDRTRAMETLTRCGVDTSDPAWKQWVDMGELS